MDIVTLTTSIKELNMAELSHVSMKFGDVDKIRTKHLYTREQALEIQQIAAKAAEIALKHRVELVPLPVKGGEG